MARGKGSWNGEPAVPYYPKTKDIEAAKLLQSVAKRYAAEKANKADVEAAIEEWHNATRKSRPEAADGACIGHPRDCSCLTCVAARSPASLCDCPSCAAAARTTPSFIRSVLLKLTSAAEAALADHLEDSQCLNDLEAAVGDAHEALFGA